MPTLSLFQKSPITGKRPLYQDHPAKPITASKTIPVASVLLFLRDPPKNVLTVGSFGTGDGIHFSSSLGIDIKLRLDLAELELALLL